MTYEEFWYEYTFSATCKMIELYAAENGIDLFEKEKEINGAEDIFN